MDKKFNVAIVGCGDFSKNFVRIFQAHPYVNKVYVCDVIKERANEYKDKFNVQVIDSFDDVLASNDVDAVAIFTQRHLHGPMVVKSLKAGKHVYSAVPMAIEVEDCRKIVDAVKETGLTYMMGETCIYYPCAMYCKKENDKGTFGNFVFAESQYFHDISHFPKNQLNSPDLYAAPFYYPTHSTAMVLHATGAYVKKVSAVGVVDKEDTGYYKVGQNQWDNVFSNEISLMQLSNGGVARVSECRRIGYKAPSSYISGFYGTKASYQYSNAQHLLTKLTEQGVDLFDVSNEVCPYEMSQNKDTVDFKQQVANHRWAWDNFAPVQDDDVARLPKEVLNSPGNGHMGSHKLLVDDFCKAVHDGTLPTVNAWVASRFTVPGLIAHQSALRGGELLDVPDFGDAPENFKKQ